MSTKHQQPLENENETPQNTTTTTTLPPHLNPQNYPQTLTNPPKNNIHLTLTYTPLDPTATLSHISHPQAGANVLFIGTTRSETDAKPVQQLSYSAYAPLALRSMMRIAEEAVERHGLLGVAIAHRLGVVEVCGGSVVVGVSAGHRGVAWRGGEEVLEAVKARVEVWKREVFVGGGVEGDGRGVGEGAGEGVWRANRDRDAFGRVVSQSGGSQ